MNRKAVYVCVLLWDVFLWLLWLLLLLSGVVWPRVPGCGSGLAALWTFSILKWVVIHTWVVAVTDRPSPAPLRRFVAHLCLLLPLVESGRPLWSSAPGVTWSPDLGSIALSQVSSIVACVLCDVDLSSSSGLSSNSGRPEALLRRVLPYFLPDLPHLLVAFGFLILGVACTFQLACHQ